MLAPIVAGVRISLTVCAVVIAIDGSIGVALGTVSGHVGGRVDRVWMRLVDLALSLPVILLAQLLASLSGPSFTNIVIVISLMPWSRHARMAGARRSG